MKRKFVPIILILVLFINQFSFVSHASESLSELYEREAETQQAISNLEKQTKETKDAISALQGQKEQTQASVNNLENQKGSLQSTINGYSSKLTTLDEEISDAEDAMAEVSAEIVKLNNELFEAQQQEKDRYEALKKRLKNTYESGGTGGLVRVLLESKSLGELLTKSEYLNAIVRYDRQKIAEFKDLQADIEAKKKVVEEREAELDAYQDQLDEKHDELEGLTNQVMGQLSATNSSLKNEKNKLADYDSQLASLDEKMKALESQVAAAQAKLAQQIAERLALMKEDLGGSYNASDTELIWLAATIQAEADGESYTGKLGVGSVIMNRVKSSAFPNTVIGVITQNMQFASYRSGKVELFVERGPNSTCVRAAQEVLGGARVGDYLFFMTKYWADYYRIKTYTMIGNHAFFYRWETYDPPEPEPEPTEDAQPEESSGDSGESQPEESSGDSGESQPEEEQHEESSDNSEENDDTDGGGDDGGDDGGGGE